MVIFTKNLLTSKQLFLSCLLLQAIVFQVFTQTNNTQFLNYYTQANTLSIGGDENVIWIGTTGGISVLNINGTQLGTYTRDNTDGGVAFNTINDVATDKNSVKWFATYGGLSKFDSGKFTRLSGLNSGLKSDLVYTVAVDTANAKWVGTAAGVYKYDEKTWVNYKKTDGLSNDTIVEIAVDKQKNHIWAGSNSGLSRFDGTKWTTFTKAANALPSNKITALYVDKKSVVWVGTLDAGVASFDGTTWKTYALGDDAGSSSVSDITADAAGVLWLTTLGGGASSYDGKTFKNYRPSTSGLASTTVRAAFVDVLGNKWFGTDKGVSKFNDQGWVNFNLPSQSLASNDVRALATDIAGNIWAGTFNYGISRFDGANWVTYNNTNSGMSTNNVNYIAVDKYNVKWICTDKGVYTFDGANWRGNDPSNSGIASYFVRQMVFDSKGIAWMATDGGVARYDGNVWKNYQISDTTFASNTITSIAVDSKDNIYAGINKKGIAVFNGKKWSSLNAASGLLSDNINAISIDTKDAVWVGTDKGISVYVPNEKVINYTTANSNLPDNNINTLAATQGGNVWVGTKAGLVKFFNGKSTMFNTANSNISDNSITAINPYILGGVWIGTLNGLSKWTPKLEGKITVTAPKCKGDNSGTATVVAAGEAAPFTYKWSSGATEATAKNLVTGYYIVTISDANGDFVVTTGQIGDGNSPVTKLSVKGETTANAKNGIAEAITTGGLAPYVYNWSNGIKTAKNDKLSPGKYFLTVTDGNGCKTIDSVSVKACSALTIAFNTVATTCNGTKDGKVSATISGGTAPYSYVWSNGALTDVVKDLPKGKYKVTISDKDGCGVSDSTTITEPAFMQMTFKTTDVAGAAATNGGVTITTTGGVPPYTYKWADATLSGSTATNLKVGDYSVTVFDKNMCGVTSKFSIKVISAVNEPELVRQVQISPNPTKGDLNLTWNLEKTAEMSVILYDVMGRIVLQQAIGKTNAATQSLNLSALPQGIYTLKINIGVDAVVKRIEVVR
jgi:ligand-binding sensor domain-containing protein